MRAILLAAGRGKRLESDAPKCLLEIEGKTLLERHFANLVAAGIDALTIVVGYQSARVRDFVSKLGDLPLPIELIENTEFVHGSIVSLQKASARLLDGAIYMDADVIYPAALLRRLVTSKNDNCVLLDRRSEETGEEMMLGVREGRVHAIARRVSPLGPWDLMGEAVGFAKVGREGGAAMKRLLDREVAAGRLDQEYEAAMNEAFSVVTWGFEPVDDFAWTEIDFKEDVEKAKLLAKTLDG
jgi:choline kinase